MSDPMDWLRPVMDMAARNNPVEDGDYIDGEGFICCGKCHTRRQAVINVPDLKTGEKMPVKVPVSCECRSRAEEARRRDEQQRKEMEVVAALKKQSLMGERLRDATFENFRETKNNAKVLRYCRRYAEHFDEMEEKNQGLLFYGGVGTGKTFAAACIANYLLDRRISVVMTSFIKLLDAMQTFQEDDSVMLSRLNRAKLLIIDDLGAERGTDFALEKVYDIIDSRDRAKRPLILTTNLDIEEMKSITDRRYSRIYDRIFRLCYPVRFAGQSWRKTEAAKRSREMEAFLEGD